MMDNPKEVHSSSLEVSHLKSPTTAISLFLAYQLSSFWIIKFENSEPYIIYTYIYYYII